MSAADLTADLAAAGVSPLADGDAARLAVDGCAPRFLARPGGSEAVSAVLRAAAARGLSVVARGGGTQMGLGDAPDRLDILLDLAAMNRIVEYRPRDLAITVEAGITMAALAKAVAEYGQIVALDPPLPQRATAGGTVAANATGPRRFRYGTARDLVIGTEAVLADGTRIKAGGKVVKNVAGYDLNKLFVGSTGTLGIITRLTFKLLPAPAVRETVVARFDTMEAAQRAAMSIANAALSPLSLDVLNAAAAGAGPEDGAGSWWLTAEAGGTHATVERTRNELRALAAGGGARLVDVLTGDESDGFAGRLRDLGFPAEDGPPLLLRLSVLPSQTADAFRLLRDTAGDLGTEPMVVVRAGNGSVLTFWQITETETVRALVARLRDALSRLGGIVTVDRCPPAAKAGLDMWGLSGPDVALMRRVKQVFDPEGTLSPGRV